MDAAEVPAARVGLASRLSPDQRNSLPLALILPAVILLGLLLRAIPWLANLPLHHDEALYGTWARAIADGSDPLLLGPWVDKPPLVLYLLGLGIKLFGASELALRVPGMLAGVLTVWATYGLARRTAGVRAAWIAAALMALSPFAILFGPTAFTDGWLTFYMVAAAWAALAGRPGWAGVLLGLACASKQQGVMAAPLVAGLIVAWGMEREGASAKRVLAALGMAALGFAAVFGAVTYWDSLRWHNRPSYWDQSLRTYGGVVLARLAEWPARAAAWARQAGYWFGAWPVTALLVALAAAQRPAKTNRRAARVFGGLPVSARFILLYILGYLLVHVAFTFQPWDRYLLPILPLACVLIGQGLVAAWDALKPTSAPGVRPLAAAALAAVLIFAAAFGVRAAIPVGSDIGAYRGVAEAARFLAHQPPGSTVYFDRIGWHLGYYLYDLPITRSWYDSPQKLASETARVAAEHGDAVQWLALPKWERARLPSLSAALAGAGFSAWPAYEVAGANGDVDVTLYRLERSALASGREQGDSRDAAGARP